MTAFRMTVVALGAALVLPVGASRPGSAQDMDMKMMKVDKAMVDSITSNWKAEPKMVAQTMIAKYGLPQEASTNRLFWMNNGPWKWTELINEEIQHDFPKPHKDMLKQVIAWKVPADKFDELAEYDGSVVVERTKGEISARCDKEEANFLALNLAHDIIAGKRSAGDARKMYSEAVGEMKHPQYMAGLIFQTMTGAQGDPDKATIDPMKMKK